METLGQCPLPGPDPEAERIETSGPVYYFSDCQAGAEDDCVAGDNANPGTSPSSPKQTLAGFNLDALPAGSQVLFAKGGAWTNFKFDNPLNNTNVTPEQPLVFDSYEAAWSSGGAPRLSPEEDGIAFLIGYWRGTAPRGGYVIRNLILDGNVTVDGNGDDAIEDGRTGVFIFGGSRHVLIENMEITNFYLASELQQTYLDGEMLGPIHAPTFRNNHIHHNFGMGILGDGTDLLIECNHFSYNNHISGTGFNHGVYLGGHGVNGTVRSNLFHHNSIPENQTACTGGNMTAHGEWDGLLIENNRIVQEAAADGCYGISIYPGYDSTSNPAFDTPESFRNLVIRGNTVINLGMVGIGASSAPGIVVENNLVINTQARDHQGISIAKPSNQPPRPNDAADTGAIVRNNTLYMPYAGAWGLPAISFMGLAGENLQAVSNLIYLGNSRNTCFRHEGLSSFDAFDNNLCFYGSNGGWSTTHSTLATAQAAGFDLNGLNSDPLFVEPPAENNDWNDALQADSPAIDNGELSFSSEYDRLGMERTVPDIGAREWLAE